MLHSPRRLLNTSIVCSVPIVQVTLIYCLTAAWIACNWILCRTSRDWIVTERSGRCHAFWLSAEGDVAPRRTSETRPIRVDREPNSIAESSTKLVGQLRRRRRCVVARMRKRMLVWKTRHFDEDCSVTHCFVCYRRELPSFPHSASILFSVYWVDKQKSVMISR